MMAILYAALGCVLGATLVALVHRLFRKKSTAIVCEHEWTQWGPVESVGTYAVQFRTCTMCGKSETLDLNRGVTHAEYQASIARAYPAKKRG